MRISSAQRGWCVAAAAWSLVFAAPHVYWALGGRAGLGTQAAQADAALEQGWFAAYNLVTAALAIAGAALAMVLAQGWAGHAARRWLLIAATAASAVLLLRGTLGLSLLAGSLLLGTYEPTPAILLAIEPWFVLGGLTYGAMALSQRARR